MFAIRSHRLGLERSRSAGMSLVETAIVLGVMGIVLAAIWLSVGPVQEKIRQARAAQEITTVVTNIRALYQGQAMISGTFNGLRPGGLTNSLIYNGAIPNDMIRDRSASPVVVDHPWGASGAAPNGSFVVSDNNNGDALSTTDGQSFRIRLDGLPNASCIAMAMKITPQSGPTGLTGVVINADHLFGSSSLPWPITVTAAKIACNSPVNANHVDYIFRLRQQN